MRVCGRGSRGLWGCYGSHFYFLQITSDGEGFGRPTDRIKGRPSNLIGSSQSPLEHVPVRTERNNIFFFFLLPYLLFILCTFSLSIRIYSIGMPKRFSVCGISSVPLS